MTYFLKAISLFLLLTLTCLGVWQYQAWNSFLKNPLIPLGSHFIYIVKPGDSVSSIAADLQRQGYLKQRYQLILLARWMKATPAIKAGEYDFVGGSRPQDILRQLVKGQVIIHSFTIVEGLTFQQLLDALNNNPYLQHTFTGLSKKEILENLASKRDNSIQGIGQEITKERVLRFLLGPVQAAVQTPNGSGTALEGQFFPATYRFTWGTSDAALLYQAQQLMDRILRAEWAQRATDLPYKSPYEALIAASLIEKETALIPERPLVAEVIINRLHKHMLLQIDPTVIYGLGAHYFGKLTHFDLVFLDTPYNTYIHEGLPPSPIALPSLSAIQATLHPSKGNSLYFVAKGDGSHQFSSELSDHNSAVKKYLATSRGAHLQQITQQIAQKGISNVH
jgi:UPF0755 protein